MPVGHTTAKPIKTKEICFYGCGRQAHYQFKNGRVCCEKDFRQCPGWLKLLGRALKGQKAWNKGLPPNAETRVKIGLGNKGKKAVIHAQAVITTQLCEYGCGQKANYVFSNGKLCCLPDFKSCSGFINRHTKTRKEKYDTYFRNVGTKQRTADLVHKIIKEENISMATFFDHLIHNYIKDNYTEEN